MTTETSNARGEAYGYEHDGKFWPAADATPWVIHHATPLYTAPPPAAARGDVRGLVAQWQECSCGFSDPRGGYESCPECGAALAAEGVQAGEDPDLTGYYNHLAKLVHEHGTAKVEQRARELLAAELYARSLHEDAYPVAVGAVLDGVVAASVAAIASALSQQPEARGVVDEAMVVAIADHVRKWMGPIGRDLGAGHVATLHGAIVDGIHEAALTGERNG